MERLLLQELVKWKEKADRNTSLFAVCLGKRNQLMAKVLFE